MNGKVKKKELYSIIAYETGVSEEDVEKVILSSSSVVLKLLVKNDKVELGRFGLFLKKNLKSKLIKNHRGKGTNIMSDEKIVVRFSPSSIAEREFKEILAKENT